MSADPEQVVGAMNVELQAGELLAELRDAYRSLPRPARTAVSRVLSVFAQELVNTEDPEQKVSVIARIQTAGPEIEPSPMNLS